MLDWMRVEDLMPQVELKLDIDADLLRRAQSAGVPIPSIVEAALRNALADDDAPPRPLFAPKPPGWTEDEAMARARRWADENAEAIAEHNAWIEEHGLVADHFRKW
jgi:antitoxin CcdA